MVCKACAEFKNGLIDATSSEESAFVHPAGCGRHLGRTGPESEVLAQTAEDTVQRVALGVRTLCRSLPEEIYFSFGACALLHCANRNIVVANLKVYFAY